MAHACFSCGRRAWDSAVEEAAEPEEPFVVHLQEPCGPWALPFYPKLGDPFPDSPGFLDSLGCFCRLPCGVCPSCGRLLQENPGCPEPQPTAWTHLDPQAAAGEADPAQDLSGTAPQETLACLGEDLLAHLLAEPALGRLL